MTDLARLGIVVESAGIVEVNRELDALPGNAQRAERATDGLARSSRGMSSATLDMLRSIEASVRQLVQLQSAQQGVALATERSASAAAAAATANVRYSHSFTGVVAGANSAAGAVDRAGAAAARAAQNARASAVHFDALHDAFEHNFASQYVAQMNAATNAHGRAAGSTKKLSLATLDLSRQFADIGVTAAMGMNPLMILLQQGPQIADRLAMMKMEGIGLSAAFRSMAASAAPFLIPLAAIGAAVGVAAAGFGLFHRELAKGYPKDITDGLGLTEEQLDRVKHKTVTFGDTFQATLNVIGRHIMAGPVGDGLRWLEKFFSDVLDNIARATMHWAATHVGMFVGAYEAVRATWRMLPAAMSDILASTANATLNFLEAMVNRAVDKLNLLIRAANLAAAAVGLSVQLPELPKAEWGEFVNENQGAAAAAGETAAKSFNEGFNKGYTGTIKRATAFAAEVRAEAIALARKQALKEAGDPNKTRAGKSEAEREYDRAIAAAERYIDATKRETMEVGLNVFERKKLAGELAIEALSKVASTEQTKRLTAAIREQTDALVDRLMLQELIDAAKARSDALAAQEPANLEVLALERYLDVLGEVDAQTRAAAQGMASAFGDVGQAIAGVTVSMSEYRKAIAESYLLEARRKADRPWEAEEITARAARERAQIQVRGYGDMAAAAKGFFKEGTAGYRGLQAAEIAFRAVEMTMSIAAMGQKAAEVSAHVAAEGTKATASGIAAYARTLASLPFPFNLAAGATVLAALAAVGVAIFGGRGSASAPGANDMAERQSAQGTGSVLGDMDAKSESIARSLELVEQHTNRDLEYSNEMLKSLRSIDDQIGMVAAALAKSFGAGRALDTSGLGLGTTTQKPGLGTALLTGGLSMLLPGLFGGTTTRTLQDQGIQLGSGSLGDILAGGLTGNAYQQVLEQTTKKFLGFTYSNKSKTSTTTSPLDEDFLRQTTLLIGSLRQGVLSAASVLGVEGAEAVLDAMQIAFPKLSFKDMDASQIQAELEAVFGKVADDMAATVVPGLAEFQKAGEGLFETLTRVARQYQVIDVTLASIGMSFNQVGIASLAARERLVDLFGGLDEFTERSQAFAEDFLSEAERLVPIQKAVTAEMARLGLAGVTTKDEFKNVVLGLDLTTEAGAEMYAALLAVAPAFAAVQDAAAKLAAAQTDLQIRLLDAQGSAAAQAMQRQKELAGLDPALRAMQMQVWAVEDAAAAAAASQEKLSAVYERSKSKITAARQEYEALLKSLGAFGKELMGDLVGVSPQESYARALAEFQRVSAMPNSDAAKFDALQSAGKALVDATLASSATALDANRDIAGVLAAVQAAEAYAQEQVSVADQQLAALEAQVAGLIDVKSSTDDVAAAVREMHAALAMKQQAMSGRAWGVNPVANMQLAQATGYAGDFGSGGFQAWIEQQPESVKAIAREVLRQNGQEYRISFAHGAVFTNGIVSQPTLFDIGRMGEAGDEAIVPLVRTPEGLGVRSVAGAANDEDAVAAALNALTAEVAELKRASVATARSVYNIDRRGHRQEIDGAPVRGPVPGEPIEVLVKNTSAAPVQVDQVA